MLLKNVIGSCHVYRPSEFITLSFVVNFFNRNVVFFAPVIINLMINNNVYLIKINKINNSNI